MSSVECLRTFVMERLTVAAEEIFRVFQQKLDGYEEELDYQRRLVESVWRPHIKLHRTGWAKLWMEKAFDHVPRGVLWGVLREAPLIRAVRSLYDRCQSLVHIAGNDWPVTSKDRWICSPPNVKRLESSQDPPGHLPGEVFRACPSSRRPPGRPRTRLRDYVSRLVWERLGIPPDELEEVAGKR
ncbi:uncharacterized protein isoform X2 [Takifugu rubripes]|uniref:uncharacterized protein isoform X2 n=1 Tax=Takifugu rubripes TaxID=31033 RepID=UPI0011456C4F|nr:uncharacterized protein LOC115249251 isoform X2 [Takifugu rubripes]